MAKKINNIHDKFFKAMMSDRQLATDFFLSFLPTKVLQYLDMGSMTTVQNGFISKELNEVFSDVLFLFRLKNSEKECYISILIEHKSIKEENTPFQILSYLGQGYEAQIKSKQPLRLIIPFLFYHGKSEWKLKAVPDFFKHYPKELLTYLPQFETIFVDLSKLSDEAIMGIANLLLASALLSQKYSSHPKELEKRLLKIFSTLTEHSNRNFVVTLVVYLFQMVEVKENLIEIIEKVPEPIKNEIMSTYDYLIQKGKIEGLEQGKENALKEIVINADKNGMSVALIANITNLSEERVKEILGK